MSKSWAEKMKVEGYPKVVPIEGKAIDKWGPGTMVISCPEEIKVIMSSVPSGEVITINEIRERLSKKHKTTKACPITTGIFAWIVAHAVEEVKAQGIEDKTAWWRTLKGDGEINPKFPGGIDMQKILLENEGHVVVQKGKRWMVER